MIILSAAVLVVGVTATSRHDKWQMKGVSIVSQQPAAPSHMTWRRSALSARLSMLRIDISALLMAIGLAALSVLSVGVWLLWMIITAAIAGSL